MRTEQTIRWLLPALVSSALVFAACTGIADTRAATISTPALIFESPTPSTALEGGAADATPDLVVVVVTPTADGTGAAANQAAAGNQDTAGNTNVTSGEGGNDAAQTPAASSTVTATTTAAAQTGAATPASVELSEDELLSTGEQVFSTNCASCHQLNGQGTAEYPALTNNDFVTGDDPTAVISTILHGRGEMPAFEDNLSTQQIAAVASYIRNAWDNNTAVVMVAQVRQVKQGGSAQTTPASTSGETPAASTAAATDTAGLNTANAMTGTATVTATATMTATEPVTATDQTTDTTTATPAAAAATPDVAMTTTPTATLPTAAGVTWTPAPVVTATLGTTPSPAGTPVPAADATTGDAATPAPAATASSAATPAADSGGAAATSQPAVTATPISDDQLVSMGQDIYARTCASCHQLNGEGTSSYPALNNNAFVTNEEPTGPIETVLHGRGEMPAFEDTLSNQEIAAVLSYARNTWDNSAPVVTVAQVRQVAQGGGAATGETSTDSAQGSATVTATAPMTATAAVTPTAEAGQSTPAAPTTAPAEAGAAETPAGVPKQTETTSEDGPAAQEEQTTSQTPTGEETPSASATMTSTVAAGDASAAGETGSNPQETAAAGVPKQAEATVEPPETDSMTAMDEAAEEATPVSPEALITLGENLYTMNCAACHQAEGQGIAGVYPMLAGNAFVTTADPAAVVEVVITGRAGMPRFSDDLSARQIAAILSYVRTSWDNDASAVNPEQVRTVRETIGGSGAAGGH